MSSKTNLVALLTKFGRSYNLDTDHPEPEKGKLIFNTVDGRVYTGDGEGTSWILLGNSPGLIVTSEESDRHIEASSQKSKARSESREKLKSAALEKSKGKSVPVAPVAATPASRRAAAVARRHAASAAIQKKRTALAQ